MNRRVKKKTLFSPELSVADANILEEQSVSNFVYNNRDILKQFDDWKMLGETTFVRRANGCMPNAISSVVRKAREYDICLK